MIKFRKKLLTFVLGPSAVLGIFIASLLLIGYDSRFYVVFSDSMFPNINTGDIVLVTKQDRGFSSFANLKVGDIIVFTPPPRTTPENESARTVVHRIVEIGDDPNGSRVVRTKGDANLHSIEGLDFPITMKNYVGKVTNTVPYMGILLMYIDILVRVLVQPLLYLIIGAIVVVILALEFGRRRILWRKSSY